MADPKSRPAAGSVHYLNYEAVNTGMKKCRNAGLHQSRKGLLAKIERDIARTVQKHNENRRPATSVLSSRASGATSPDRKASLDSSGSEGSHKKLSQGDVRSLRAESEHAERRPITAATLTAGSGSGSPSGKRASLQRSLTGLSSSSLTSQEELEFVEIQKQIGIPTDLQLRSSSAIDRPIAEKRDDRHIQSGRPSKTLGFTPYERGVQPNKDLPDAIDTTMDRGRPISSDGPRPSHRRQIPGLKLSTTPESLLPSPGKLTRPATASVAEGQRVQEPQKTVSLSTLRELQKRATAVDPRPVGQHFPMISKPLKMDEESRPQLPMAGQEEGAVFITSIAATEPGPAYREVATSLVRGAHSLLLYREYDVAQRYFEEVAEKATEIKHWPLVALARHYIGICQKQQNKVNEALESQKSAIELARRCQDRAMEGRSLKALGVIFFHTGDLESAKRFQEAALHLSIALKDKDLQARCCANIGNIHRKMAQYEDAIRFHMNDLRLSRETTSRVGQARACLNLSITFDEQAHLAQSRAYHEMGKELAKNAEVQDITLLCTSGIGNLYLQLEHRIEELNTAVSAAYQQLNASLQPTKICSNDIIVE